MKVSISITDYSWPGPMVPRVAEIARAADDSAIDTLWVADHLIQADPTLPPDHEDMLEAFSVLGYLSAVTERIRLGAMVAGVTFRPPALLIKAVTSLDVLSGGRMWFGIGAGHHDGEARAMGLPFPAAGARLDQVEDTVRLARQMWRGDRNRFDGNQIRLDGPVSVPAPLQSAGPPILIGGAGEKRTLNLVARYADACNLFDIPDGGRILTHKLSVLAEHCAAAGRDPSGIEKTLSTRLNPDETVGDVVRRGEAAAAMGIDHLVVIVSHPWALAEVHLMGEVAAELAAVTASR